MDKDLASATMLERYGCYNKALDAANESVRKILFSKLEKVIRKD